MSFHFPQVFPLTVWHNGSTAELSPPPLHVVPGRWRGNLEVRMKMAPNDQSTPAISVSNNDSSHMAGIVHQKTFMLKLWSVSKFILSPVGKLIMWMFFVLYHRMLTKMVKLYFFFKCWFLSPGLRVGKSSNRRNRDSSDMFFMTMYICQIRHKGGRISANLKV